MVDEQTQQVDQFGDGQTPAPPVPPDTGGDQPLAEEHRKKLDGIVGQMILNKEPEANIRAVVADFKSKYSNPLAKETDESQNFLTNYIKSPQAAKAIDKITMDSYLQDYNQGGMAQDATRNVHLPPIRLADKTQADRADFLAQSQTKPKLIRDAISESKRQNPQDAPKLNSAMYITDASKRPHSPDVVKYYAGQLANGNLDYDFNSQRLVKEEGGVASVIRGLKTHSDAIDDYNYVTTHSDKDVINKLEQDRANYDPDKPIYKGDKGLGSVGGMVGSQIVPMAKIELPKLLTPVPIVGEAAAGAGIVWGASDFHHVAYANTLGQVYSELRQKGATPDEALNHAKDRAEFSGELAAGQGLILGMAAGKATAFKPVVYRQPFLNVLKDIGENHLSLIKSMAPEAGGQAVISGGIKAIENASQGKQIGEGVPESMVGTALFMGGLAALKAKGVYLTKEAKSNLMEGYASAPPDVVNRSLGTIVQMGQMPAKDATDLHNEINATKNSNNIDVHSPITPEAEQALRSVQENGLPGIVNETLLKIFKDNGITPEKTAEGEEIPLTAEKIISGLKEKQNSVKPPETFEDETKINPENLSDVHKAMYNQDPEGFRKFLADQVHAGNREEVESAPGITKPIVDAAVKDYPEHIIQEPKESKISVIKPEENKQPNVIAPRGTSEPEYLVSRHADTAKDEQGKVSGPNEHPLSQDGKRDANDLANDVADKGVTKIVSSDLERAKETSKIVSEKTGAKTEADPDLNTWDIGDFDDAKDSEFKDVQKWFGEHPDEKVYDGDIEKFKGKSLGESLNDYANRTIKAHEKYKGEPASTLLIDHSNNMMVMDAYKKNGNKWDANAIQHYLNAEKPQPATLINNKTNQNAVQESQTGSVLQHTQEGTGTQGSERGRVEPGQQGQEAAPEGKNEGQGNVNELPFGNATDVGIAHDIQKERTYDLKAMQPTRGEGISLEQSIQRGKDLIASGVDPNEVSANFAKDNRLSSDDMSVVRAHYNELTKATDNAAEQFSENSDEYKNALKAERDWYDNHVKPMQTEWSKIGVAQQGRTDIEIGTVSGIRRVFEDQNQVPMSPEQTKTAQELSDKVKEQNDKISKLQKQLDNLHSTGGKEKVTYTDKAKAVADAFRKLKTKPFTFKDENGNEIDVHTAGIKWNDVVEAGAKIIEKTGEIADGIAHVLDNIKNADWYKGLSDKDKTEFSKQLQAHYEENAPSIALLKFENKKGNEFTPEETSQVWQHAKSNYIDKGTGFADMVNDTAMDLGLSSEQVIHAISKPKGAKVITDEMYRTMYQRRLATQRAQLWVKTANTPAASKFFKSVPNAFFAITTFGHGTVGAITHAGMDLYRPSNWQKYFPFVINQFKFAFGDTAKYEQALQSLEKDKDFDFWKRNGLAVDPRKLSTDDYRGWTKVFGKIGTIGERGFSALKFYRLAQAQDIWSHLSDEQKEDPQMAKTIANLVNLSTGTSDIGLSENANAVASTILFAPKLEASKWQRIFTEPTKAVGTLTHWESATPSEKLQAKMVARHVGEMMATMLGMLAANQGVLILSGSKQRINFTNPLDSDWLKFKAGGIQVDASGGMISTVRFISSLVEEGIKANLTTQGKKDKAASDVEASKITSQLRGKLSPFAGTIAELATGKDYAGNVIPWSGQKPQKGREKMTYSQYVESHLPIPFAEAFRTTHEAAKSRGMKDTQFEDVVRGIIAGAVSGGTGARITPDYKALKAPASQQVTLPTNYK